MATIDVLPLSIHSTLVMAESLKALDARVKSLEKFGWKASGSTESYNRADLTVYARVLVSVAAVRAIEGSPRLQIVSQPIGGG